MSTAELAIEEIIGQGEGESPLNPNQVDAEGYGNFYQLEELVCGKRLVKKPNGYYAYDGPPIEFDESGVYNTFPNSNQNSINSASEDCITAAKYLNNVYVNSLMQTLADAFQQGNSNMVSKAVKMMHWDVNYAAQHLFHIPYSLGSAEYCGPVWDMDFIAT